MRESGQALLLAVFIGVLIVLAIPVILFVTRTGTLHQMKSQHKTKGLALAQEGIAYARKILSTTQGTWDNALGGTFPAACPTTGGAAIEGSGGGYFRINCTGSASGLLPYQVAVTATALLPTTSGAQTPTTALQAYLSQKTLGAALPDGQTVSAALQMTNVPVLTPPNDALRVHWGPIVCTASTPPWILSNPLDQASRTGAPPITFRGFPRKYSNSGINGTLYTDRTPTWDPVLNPNVTTSDQKEYWAFASMSLSPIIDSETFKTDAKNSTLTFNPVPVCTGCPPDGLHYALNPPDGTIPFSGTTSAGNPDPVIYVEGNATLSDTSYDLGNGGLIVTGNLTLMSAGGGFSALSLHVPATSAKEYAYWPPGGTQWPCNTYVGGNCSVPQAGLGNVHIRGFVYVMGDLIVSVGTNSIYQISGAVMVGGKLRVTSGELSILYDDTIAKDTRHIHMLSTELQVDTLKEVSAL